MAGKHARLSASSAHRWLICAGGVGSGGASAHAALGTFAHEIAAKCLQDELLTPNDFFLQKHTIDGHSVQCDMEMIDGVRVYLEAVRDDHVEGDLTWVEMSLLEELSDIDPDLGGTADHVRYRPSTQELIVTDFKYGSGVYVEAENNEQLKLYALGALLEVLKQGHKAKRVRIRIVQPRYEGAAPVRDFEFNAAELLDFAADVQDAAERTREKNPRLVAGEHCKFCPNSRTCPELERRHHALIEADLGQIVDVKKVAELLTALPLVKERIKAIEEHAYELACQGVDIPGYKLADKRPVRKWRSEGDVIEWAQANAIEPWAPRELLSPAQLEAKLKESAPKGKKKEAGAILEPFIERISSGTVLVPVADDRPAAKRTSENDFAVIDGVAKPTAQAVVNLF